VNPDLGFAIIAVLVAAYGLVAMLLARYSVSAAFSFTVIGAVIGGAGLGLMVDPLETTQVSFLAEITLALVLFADASSVDLRKLTHDAGAVVRLLLIGLPLTLVGGTVLALGLFPEASFGVALLIAATLAPTDGALGQAVITDRAVPARIRRILNVESGLNDGIAAPVVTLAIAIAIAAGSRVSQPLLDAVLELILAGVVGVVVGYVGSWLLVRADALGWTSPASRMIVVLAMAFAAYFFAVGLGASGFVAAFVAGLAFKAATRKRAATAVRFTEALGGLLSIAVWLIFGLVVVAEHLIGGFDVAVILYAVLSLTLVRMVPVALALFGERFQRPTVAFIGWFGPRGLASIVFLLLGLESLEAAGVATGPLPAAVAWTVFLSIVLHGFSAKPLAGRFGRFARQLPDDSPEWLGDEEPRARTRMAMSFHPADRAAEELSGES
jgi:NhaP-type Na+/H+ or K+/H+ antiporter